MSESNEPLIRAPGDETVIGMRSADSASSKKAFKVAGLTVLVCFLVAGQALTAYFIFNQRSKIGDIEDSNEALRKQMFNQNSGSSGSKMVHVPIHSMPMRMNVFDDKQPSIPIMTEFKCRQDKQSSFKTFQLKCDVEGNYLPLQCWDNLCWCVDKNGDEIPNSLVEGRLSCNQMPALGVNEAIPMTEELSDG